MCTDHCCDVVICYYDHVFFRFSPFVKTGTEAFVLGSIAVKSGISDTDKIKIVYSPEGMCICKCVCVCVVHVCVCVLCVCVSVSLCLRTFYVCVYEFESAFFCVYMPLYMCVCGTQCVCVCVCVFTCVTPIHVLHCMQVHQCGSRALILT